MLLVALLCGINIFTFQMILSSTYMEHEGDWNSKVKKKNVVFTTDTHSMNVSIGNSDGNSNTTESLQRLPGTTKNIANEKYLLPVLLGNQGFNNQLQAFKIASFVAQKRNLTLVLAPFFEHQYSLETQQPRSFEQSLDSEVLAKFVSVISLDEFKGRCNSSVEAMFAGTNMARNQSSATTTRIQSFVEATIRVYRNHTGIRIPSLISNVNDSDVVIHAADDLPFGVPIDDFLDRYPQSLTTSKKCTAFVYAYGYLNRLPYWVHVQRYNHYFLRSKKVRAMAKHFTTQVMKNSSFVCVHWRFNDEWNTVW